LAHYVRTFMPKPPEDKPEDLAWLGPIDGGGGGGAAPGGLPGGPATPTPTIPIELALRLMAEPAAATLPSGSAIPPGSDTPGGIMFGQRCASCHGASGEGGVRVRMLGSAPYAYMTTQPLGASHSGWAGDPARFEKLILEGLPGYAMPGNGDLSREEIRQLYDFTNGLTPATTSTPPGGNRS
ncbi:MAG TPA: c-type cytochrome, partial [Candidatus Saccharimonadales bacterium]|nr:c-type cytochrome [Candidatus Saccharimonadales bacterium]